jgi:hypothetical protein
MIYHLSCGETNLTLKQLLNRSIGASFNENKLVIVAEGSTSRLFKNLYAEKDGLLKSFLATKKHKALHASLTSDAVETDVQCRRQKPDDELAGSKSDLRIEMSKGLGGAS